MVELGLKQLLIDAGVDLERDGVRIVGVPGTDAPGVSFGSLQRARSRTARSTASGPTPWGRERRAQGVGKVILDIRRGIGPVAAFHYTMPSWSRAMPSSNATRVGRWGMRAVLAAQRALKADVRLATTVGRALFPPAEAR